MSNVLAGRNAEKQFVITEIDSGTKITNSELYQQSFSYTESICSEESLRFGGCESSMLKFKIKNNGISLKNKCLKVDILENEALTTLGYFRVYSDKMNASRTNREITAYDKMYEIVNTEISEWYNGITFPITIKNFRKELFNYIDCEQREVDLPNDDELIYSTPFSDNLFCGDVLKDICEVNGCFGKIGNDDVFDYVFLEKTASFEIQKSQYGSEDLTYEDYETNVIDGITLVQSNSDTEFYYNPDGKNLYTIETRALFFGEKQESVVRLLENVYKIVCDIKYVPLSIKCLGQINRACGSRIKVYTREEIEVESYVFERNMSGTRILKDNIEASGTEYYEKRQNNTDRAIYYTNKNITDIYKNSFYSYTYTNALKYSISQNSEVVIEFNVAATTNTDVILIATIPIEITLDAELILKYYIDAAEVENTELRKYLHKGKNFVTITNYFGTGENERLTLTVSVALAYTESVERQQQARLLALENYVQTGTYTEEDIDTSVANGTIEKWGIKAVLFAKGIAGTEEWDGTINVTDTFGKIAVVTPQVKTFKDHVSTINSIPGASEFAEVFGRVLASQTGIVGFNAEVEVDEKVTNYTFDTSKAERCEYDRNYVLSDDSYHLRTEYAFSSKIEKIDSGSMCSLELRTDDKSSIESVEVENGL